MAAVEIDLEGKDHEHAVDVGGDGGDAALAPGPDLRADVVDHRNPQPAEGSSEAQIELREIDQDRRRRPSPLRLGDEPGQNLARPRQDRERLDDADDLAEPEDLAGEAIEELQGAVADLGKVLALLENGNGNGKAAGKSAR